MGTRYLVAMLLMLGWSAEAAGQTVSGRVVEDETGVPVAQAEVAAATAGGREVASVLSDGAGNFELRLPSAGPVTLRARRLGYAPSAPLQLEVREGSTEVLIRLRPEAIRLDAITATRTRGRLPRAATVDGMYERRAILPRVGGNRVFVKGDPELESAGRVGDILDRWLQIGRIAQGRCVVFFVNGVPQHPMMDPRTFVREMSPSILEGLEYYRDSLGAPLEYQGHGCWESPIYSIVAVWFAR